MRRIDSSLALVRFALPCAAALMLAACDDGGSTGPGTAPDALRLTAAQAGSLDSTGRAITQANPGDPDLKALADSTLEALTAGVEARRVNVSTDLTAKPLYFVGIHRVASGPNGSFSTWNLVGIDDPSKLTSLIEVSGFAAADGAAAPASVSGTIGDGTGIVNGMMLEVGTGGAVTKWIASAGTVSFSSGAPGAACPNFTPTAHLTCALETMRVRCTLTAPSGSGGAGARQASVAAEVDVPAMRLAYTP